MSFAYTGPGPLTERVNGYYKEFEENGAPVTPQMNPNILAIGGDLSMMVAPTDEQAVERLGMGGGFFAFGIMHYYMTGMHTPGRTGVWKRHLEEIEKDPSVVYGPGRGPIGSPATVREFLRGYEESGVDELILLLTPRSHEATMESIELMGKDVLPEFIERDEKAVAEKAKRLEPIIEKVEARRPASKAPAFDESYAFGGLPTGRENYTANEVSLAMDEMNAGIEAAAAKLKSGARVDQQEPGADRTEEQRSRMGQIDELWRYDGRRVVVTGCASGIGEHVARQLTELGAEVSGLDRDERPPALQLKEFHEIDLADPASIDQAAASIDGQVDALFNIAGVSSGIRDPLRVVTINFLGTRQFTEALVPTMPPGSAIANVSSLAASAYRENAAVTAGLLDTVTMAEGIEWCRAQSGGGCRRRRLPAVQGGDDPLRDGQRCGTGRQGNPDQLHRPGSHRYTHP